MTVIQVYVLTSNTEEAEFEQFYEDLWRRTKEPLDESEIRQWKFGLKLNIQKTKIMISSPI